jgi:hypothetical protein
VDIAERHEQHVVVSETDDFGESALTREVGFDTTDVTDGGEWSFGFGDEADELDDAAVVTVDGGLPDSTEGGLETVGGGGRGLAEGDHGANSCSMSASLVSRRASMTPKEVRTRHPPRVTSGDE